MKGWSLGSVGTLHHAGRRQRLSQSARVLSLEPCSGRDRAGEEPSQSALGRGRDRLRGAGVALLEAQRPAAHGKGAPKKWGPAGRPGPDAGGAPKSAPGASPARGGSRTGVLRSGDGTTTEAWPACPGAPQACARRTDCRWARSRSRRGPRGCCASEGGENLGRFAPRRFMDHGDLHANVPGRGSPASRFEPGLHPSPAVTGR